MIAVIEVEMEMIVRTAQIVAGQKLMIEEQAVLVFVAFDLGDRVGGIALGGTD